MIPSSRNGCGTKLEQCTPAGVTVYTPQASHNRSDTESESLRLRVRTGTVTAIVHSTLMHRRWPNLNRAGACSAPGRWPQSVSPGPGPGPDSEAAGALRIRVKSRGLRAAAPAAPG
eukprot:340647-Rhodomonas_salina.1